MRRNEHAWMKSDLRLKKNQNEKSTGGGVGEE